MKQYISDVQFKKACKRIENGEIELVAKVKDHFLLEETQEKLLDLYLITKHLRKSSEYKNRAYRMD